jgi:hypothetical protein
LKQLLESISKIADHAKGQGASRSAVARIRGLWQDEHFPQGRGPAALPATPPLGIRCIFKMGSKKIIMNADYICQDR